MGGKTRLRFSVLLGRFIGAVVFSVALLGAGCALSPQTVEVEPALALEPSDLGQGRTVALQVQDNRTQDAIGARGGIYDTATISAVGDIRLAVEKAMTQALTTQGFQVVAADVPADLRMRVSLDDLSYVAHGDPMVRAVQIGAKVSGTVKRASQQYSSRAGITETRDVIRPPAPVDNEAYINDALAHALERLISDPKFIEFVR